MKDYLIGKEIERLLQYGRQRGLLEALDIPAARNELLDLFRLARPFDGEVLAERMDSPADILAGLVGYAGDAGLFDAGSDEQRARFDNRIMGCLMPRPSQVAERFSSLWRNRSIQAATRYFYKLSLDSNYIRMAEIRRNVQWTTRTPYGRMAITINLTKPEKDPDQIAQAVYLSHDVYPQCQLCPENMGFTGRSGYPSRQTLRLIPLTINGERWYFQYSPYVYYREHCIVLSEKHEPMTMGRATFEGLLDFVRQFPHYLCGSNTELPIVGGSILSHNHFQGGRCLFPIHRAKTLRKYSHPQFTGLTIQYLKWPLSTLRLSGHSASQLVELACHLLEQWRSYSDAAVDILAVTPAGDGQTATPHNTVTPIVRVNAGSLEMDLILRNNRTSEQHPLGIFHLHAEIHPIKKENIGLIEAMGLAILPGRLDKELAAIQSILTGKIPLQPTYDSDPLLSAHAGWIQALVNKHGCACTEEDAQSFLHDAVGRIFTTGLEHCGVFKQDEAGYLALDRFLSLAGCCPAQGSQARIDGVC